MKKGWIIALFTILVLAVIFTLPTGLWALLPALGLLPVVGLALRDLYHELVPVSAVNITNITQDGTTTGSVIDLQGFEGALIVVKSGTITDGDYDIELYAADNSNMNNAIKVDTAAEGLLGSLPSFGANDDDAIKYFGYNGTLRYIQVKIVASNVSNGGTLEAIAIKGYPVHAPAV